MGINTYQRLLSTPLLIGLVLIGTSSLPLSSNDSLTLSLSLSLPLSLPPSLFSLSLSHYTYTRQLNKIMSQVDLMQALFERAGGAKHAGVLSTLARKRKSRSSVRLRKISMYMLYISLQPLIRGP